MIDFSAILKTVLQQGALIYIALAPTTVTELRSCLLASTECSLTIVIQGPFLPLIS